MALDITPKLILICKSSPDLVSLVQDRISSPSFPLNKDEEMPNPKVALRQVGGGVEYYKYQFIVRGDTLQQAREVAIVLSNYLTENAVSLSDCNLEWVEIDGSINDSVDETTKQPEVFFYANFYLLEA